MRIYITHCSAKKDNSLKNTGQKVAAEQLYAGNKIQNFINVCKERMVRWAIFSDKYGMWFPNEKHEWYEKSPDDVAEMEFEALLESFDTRLQNFSEIWFFHNVEDFHPLYQRLVKETKLRDRLKLFMNLDEVA